MAAAQVEWGKVALSEGALCAKSVSQGLPLFQSFTGSLFILTALCGFGCRLFFKVLVCKHSLVLHLFHQICILHTVYVKKRLGQVHGLMKSDSEANGIVGG